MFLNIGKSDASGLLDIGFGLIWILLVELLDQVVCFDVAWDCPCAVFGSVAFAVNEVLDAVSSFLARVADLIDFLPFVAAYYLWWRRWGAFLVLGQWRDVRGEL